MAELTFEILGLLRSAEKKAGISDLDLTSQEILRIITDKHFKNEKLHVGDVVQLREFGSAQNIYSKLRALIEDGWLETAVDNTDARYKKVLPSKKVIKAYRENSKNIEAILVRKK